MKQFCFTSISTFCRSFISDNSCFFNCISNILLRLTLSLITFLNVSISDLAAQLLSLTCVLVYLTDSVMTLSASLPLHRKKLRYKERQQQQGQMSKNMLPHKKSEKWDHSDIVRVLLSHFIFQNSCNHKKKQQEVKSFGSWLSSS